MYVQILGTLAPSPDCCLLYNTGQNSECRVGLPLLPASCLVRERDGCSTSTATSDMVWMTMAICLLRPGLASEKLMLNRLRSIWEVSGHKKHPFNRFGK